MSTVASFTDAWIETETWSRTANLDRSHLLQMRGLKQHEFLDTVLDCEVASFTDAWIETLTLLYSYRPVLVASFTDAWIETFLQGKNTSL